MIPLLVLHVLLVFVYFYVAINISNAATRVVETYAKNKYVIVMFHMYLLTVFYYFFTFITFSSTLNSITLFFVGPMLGIYSNYFTRKFLN